MSRKLSRGVPLPVLPCIFFSVIVPIMQVVSVRTCHAAENKITPYVALKTESNDNIFLTADNAEDDFIVTLSPGLKLASRDERRGAAFDGRLDAYSYADHSELNAIDQHYQGDAFYSPTETMRLDAAAEYVVDSRPDRDFDVSGLLFGTAKRQRQKYELACQKQFSEKTAGNLSYGYNEDRYDDPEFNDYFGHSVNLGLSHNLGRFFNETVATGSAAYGRYEYDTATVDTAQLLAGFSRGLNEKWHVEVSAGPSYTRTEFTVGRHPSYEDWGVAANAALAYKGETSSSALSFSQSVRSDTGRNGTVERSSVELAAEKNFTFDCKGKFKARYYLNRSGSGSATVNEIDEQSLRVEPRLQYRWTKDIFLSAAYAYTRITDKIADRTSERNSFILRLQAQHRLLD